MTDSLRVANRQRQWPVDCRRLRQLCRRALVFLGRNEFDLGIYLVRDRKMIYLNETFLRHAGTTDVVTFDYREDARAERLHGEIFICVDEARRQAALRQLPWPREVLRYAVHGILHLAGYDDRDRNARRQMKAMENRLLKRLESRPEEPQTQPRNAKRGAEHRSAPRLD